MRMTAPESEDSPQEVVPGTVKIQWFALRVKPRHEKAVARTLELKGYETFLPLQPAKSRRFDVVLFPGYVFSRFDPCRRLPILVTPGVVRVLGNGNMPLPVDEAEITALQVAVRRGLPLQFCPYLACGQKVRITSGPLTGLEGVVRRVRDSVRIVLSVTLLRRSVLAEVDRESLILEPAPRARISRAS